VICRNPTVICRNLQVNGRRTSLRMDEDMWSALYDVAKHKGLTPAELVSEIELQRGELSTTAALRVFVLRFYRDALREVTEARRPRRAKAASVKRDAQPAVMIM